jgi:hypothetical protein
LNKVPHLKRKLKIAACGIFISAIAFLLFAWCAGNVLVASAKCEIGKPPADLPIQQVGKITVPKFFIAGTADRDTTLPE